MSSERVRIPTSPGEPLPVRPEDVGRLIDHLRGQLTLLDAREEEMQSRFSSLAERERILESAVRELQALEARFRREREAAQIEWDMRHRQSLERDRELASREAELAARVTDLKSLARAQRAALLQHGEEFESRMKLREEEVAARAVECERLRLELDRRREAEEREFQDRVRQQSEELEARCAELMSFQAVLDHRRSELDSQVAELTRRQLALGFAETEAEQRLASRRRELEAEYALRVTELREAEAACRSESHRLEMLAAELQVREAGIAVRAEDLERQAIAWESRSAANQAQLAAIEEQRREFEEHRETTLAHLRRFNTECLAEHASRQAGLTEVESRLTTWATFLDERQRETERQSAEVLRQQADLEQSQRRFHEESASLRQQLHAREQQLLELESALQARQDEVRIESASLADHREILCREQRELDSRRQELQSQRTEWETVQRQTREELADREQELAARELEFRGRESAFEQTCERELARRAESFESQWKTRMASLDLREQELERREIDQRKRLQLYEAHRQRTQAELASLRAELEQDRQRLRLWNEQVEVSVRLRLGQMRRFRDLVEQREQALVREEELRESRHREAEADIQRSRVEWSERLAQTALAVDEQLTMFRKLNAGLAAAYDALATPGATGTFALEKLAEERRELQNWLDARTRQVAETEQRLAAAWEHLSQGQRLWESERERRHLDRIEAERLIRDLVAQLETAMLRIERLQRGNVSRPEAA